MPSRHRVSCAGVFRPTATCTQCAEMIRIIHLRFDIELEHHIPGRRAETERDEGLVDRGLRGVRPFGLERTDEQSTAHPACLSQRPDRVADMAERYGSDHEIERVGGE